MMKYLFILSVVLFGSMVVAAPPKQFSEEETRWLKAGLRAEEVEAIVLNAAQSFAEGVNGRPLSTARGNFYIAKLKRYGRYYFFEHDTKLSTRWLASVVKYMDALVNARNTLNNLEGAGKKDSAEYKQWDDYYKKTATALMNGAKKPVKVGRNDEERLKQLGNEKKGLLKKIKELEKDATDRKNAGGNKGTGNKTSGRNLKL